MNSQIGQCVISSNDHIIHHHQDLSASGLLESTIKLAGLKICDRNETLNLLKQWGLRSDGIQSSLVIPYGDGFARMKPDPPHPNMKYLQAKGSSPRLYKPNSEIYPTETYSDWIIITEGEKKALAAAQAGLECYALGGVWAWKTKAGDTDLDSTIEDIKKLEIDGSKFALVYDSDITADHKAHSAFERLAQVLIDLGADAVRIITLPSPSELSLLIAPENDRLRAQSPDINGGKSSVLSPESGNGDRSGGKVGIDDLLVMLGGERGREYIIELIESCSDWESLHVTIDRYLDQLSASESLNGDLYNRTVKSIATQKMSNAERDYYAQKLKSALQGNVQIESIRKDIVDAREGSQKEPKTPEPLIEEVRPLEAIYDQCRELAESESVLDQVDGVLPKMGFAGDRTNAKLVYLIFTSRLLDRPVNVFVTGSSSSGKTLLVKTVCRLFDKDSIYRLDASSERALIYTKQELKHRVVIFSESSAMNYSGRNDGQSIGNSIIRSLSWGKDVRYTTVDKDANGSLVDREIIKEGPISLCTTGTRALDHETQTRLLTIEIPDTPELTEQILLGTAKSFAQGSCKSVDLVPFQALQEWLKRWGAQQVCIPYSKELASRYNTKNVRSRRDFEQLLSLISSHCILHRCSRESDDDGRVIATIEDYRAVHELAGACFSGASSDGLTPSERELVDAVQRLSKESKTNLVSGASIADSLGISKDAVYQRVKNPKKLGYIQTPKHDPKAGYLSGQPLPNIEELPSPYSLLVDTSGPQKPVNSALEKDRLPLESDHLSEPQDIQDDEFDELLDWQGFEHGRCSVCDEYGQLYSGYCGECFEEFEPEELVEVALN